MFFIVVHLSSLSHWEMFFFYYFFIFFFILRNYFFHPKFSFSILVHTWKWTVCGKGQSWLCNRKIGYKNIKRYKYPLTNINFISFLCQLHLFNLYFLLILWTPGRRIMDNAVSSLKKINQNTNYYINPVKNTSTPN